MRLNLTPEVDQTLFLEGPAGAGKTTLAIERIQALISNGVSPGSILLLTPHRSYTLAYEDTFDQRSWYGLGKATIGGLARRYVSLFWPEVLEHSKYPFARGQEPSFPTYEVAQYFMVGKGRAVKPPKMRRAEYLASVLGPAPETRSWEARRS